MSLVKLIVLICLVSLCCTLECNKTKESDILLRCIRGLPVSSNQNKLNNDNIKLRLDFNNMLPKISQLRPHTIQQPITNLRTRPTPSGITNSRINAINRGLRKNIFYHPLKTVPVNSAAPSKSNVDEKKVEPVPTNITKSTEEPKEPAFYIEIDDEDNTDADLNTGTPKSPLASHVKKTVLTKLQKESSDSNKDKNDVIIGIMRELPSIIKTIIDERIKSEGNPIIIKNITEITLPIQRGEIKSDTRVSNSTKKAVQVDSQNIDKKDELNRKTNNKYSKEVLDLLLNPILQNKHNSAELLHSHSQLSTANNSENGVESIKITQNKYSEIVDRKHDPQVEETKNSIKERPPTMSSFEHPNLIPISYHNTDLAYTLPNIQATVNPNVYNNYCPMYTTPIAMHSNMYTPNAVYGQYPYQYSQYPQSFNLDGTSSKPEYSAAPDSEGKSIEADDSLDDSKNTTWKTWSNTDIVIKSNDNHADLNNRKTMMQNDNGYNNFYFKNPIMPMFRNHPYYAFPGVCQVFN